MILHNKAHFCAFCAINRVGKRDAMRLVVPAALWDLLQGDHLDAAGMVQKLDGGNRCNIICREQSPKKWMFY